MEKKKTLRGWHLAVLAALLVVGYAASLLLGLLLLDKNKRLIIDTFDNFRTKDGFALHMLVTGDIWIVGLLLLIVLGGGAMSLLAVKLYEKAFVDTFYELWLGKADAEERSKVEARAEVKEKVLKLASRWRAEGVLRRRVVGAWRAKKKPQNRSS